MCGIVGTWGGAQQGQEGIRAAVARLGHRGPDDSGLWSEGGRGIALGHARLSILDLSSAGHQPMTSACGRYVIVLNGEIYNHLDLRKDLGEAAAAWRGHSDTETLLACFSAWGVESTLKATVGMFALALWDRHEGALVLARDRLGEKPLYYGYVGGAFAFASELKALTGLPGFRRDIDRSALSALLRHNYIPAPHCIYHGLAKLLPGTWLKLSAPLVRRREVPAVRPYWSALEVARAGTAFPLTFDSDEQAVAALEAELSRAVTGQMLSDVPLGVFLSGGVDSSTVAALMQAQSTRPIKTFSIGSHDDGFDEAHYAAAVARHLGTEHTELYVSSEDALAVIPTLPSMYDEPFSDSSQIPTHLVARLARDQVTVALSGDGGDELFGGYIRYALADRLWTAIQFLPRGLRQVAARCILTLPPPAWDHLYRALAPMIPLARRWPAPGDMIHKGAMLLGAENGVDLYRQLVSHWEPADVVLGASEPCSVFTGPQPLQSTFTERMMFLDTVSYLPDDILVKVDRAAMSVSLETRVPLLDHRLLEFAWRLPLRYKIRHGVSKWLLRQVLRRHVPAQFVDRAKMGFGMPIGAWLRGPLRGWAEELLAEDRLKREGYFSPEPIRTKWREHLSGRRNWEGRLWNVLMFQAWREYWHA